jgi:signal transduction histidine kinase
MTGAASVGTDGDRPPDLGWHNALLSRGVEGLRRLDHAWPYALDCLIAMLVGALGVFDLVVLGTGPFSVAPVHAPAGWVALSVAGQALPLVWRRKAPAVVFALVLGFSVLQWSLGIAPRSAAGMLIALYGVGKYGKTLPLSWAFLASIGALSIAAFADLPFRQTPWTSEFLLGCSAVASVALAVVARYRQARAAALAERAARLEIEREQREHLATLAERARVSREMHDIVGHNLAVIIRLADGAAFAADSADTSRSAEALHLIADTGRDALNELRRTLGILHDDAPAGTAESSATSAQPGSPLAPLTRPPLEAEPALSPSRNLADLPALLERIRSAGLPVAYRSTGDPAAAPAGVQLAAYRIVQEALTNTLRHGASGASAQVDVEVVAEEIRISVRDDAGPTVPAARAARAVEGAGMSEVEGRGLRGIVERASLMGGFARAGATEDGGWAVRAVLPLRAAPANLIGSIPKDLP